MASETQQEPEWLPDVAPAASMDGEAGRERQQEAERSARWSILEDALALNARAKTRKMSAHISVDGFTLDEMCLIGRTHGVEVKVLGKFAMATIGEAAYRVVCTGDAS